MARAALKPRSFLFTLFGDYVQPLTPDGVSIAALLRLAADFGVGSSSLRSAVSRMAAEGWLRHTGRSRYALGPAGRRLISEGTRRIYGGGGRDWDGRWLMVAYSVPEGDRHLRDRLRSALLFAGFGAAGNGVFISPHDLRPDVEELIGRLGMEGSVTVVRGELASPRDPLALVRGAWELTAIAERYRAFHDRARAGLARDASRARQGRLAGARAFHSRFLLTHEYRHFPFIDPDLPAELLPPDWIGARAREVFLEYNGLLREPAEAYYASMARSPD